MISSSANAAKMLTVAISGSRTLTRHREVWPVLDERAIHYMSAGYALHLHLGDAQGVDANAIFWARERQIAERVTIFFASKQVLGCFDAAPYEQVIAAADWDSDGYAAGPIRNAAMLSGTTNSGVACSVPGCKGADVLWAIRDARARNRGTDNAIGQARASNMAIQSYTMHVGEPAWVVEETPPHY